MASYPLSGCRISWQGCSATRLTGEQLRHLSDFPENLEDGGVTQAATGSWNIGLHRGYFKVIYIGSCRGYLGIYIYICCLGILTDSGESNGGKLGI